MIEHLAAAIPYKLHKKSGKAFYSGRDAFQAEGPIYVLGYNPGGDPDQRIRETVGANIQHVLKPENHNWSSYCDESWGGKPPGTAKFQPVLCQLLGELGLDPRTTPSSNLIFVRSRQAGDLSKPAELEEVCWPFHQAVINLVKPKAIVALGLKAGNRIGSRLGAIRTIDAWSETNGRGWTSTASTTKAGPMLLTLTHPSRAFWTKQEVDPRPFAVRVLMDHGVI
jgi:Uracil DNA glycosylase superfamily